MASGNFLSAHTKMLRSLLTFTFKAICLCLSPLVVATTSVADADELPEVVDWLQANRMASFVFDCHRAIQSEKADVGWAEQAQAVLRFNFERIPEITIRHLQCKSTMCEIALEGEKLRELVTPTRMELLAPLAPKKYDLRSHFGQGVDLKDRYPMYYIFVRESLIPKAYTDVYDSKDLTYEEAMQRLSALHAPRTCADWSREMLTKLK